MSHHAVCIDVTTIENHLDSYQREEGKSGATSKTLLNRLKKTDFSRFDSSELNDSPEIVLNRTGVPNVDLLNFTRGLQQFCEFCLQIINLCYEG